MSGENWGEKRLPSHSKVTSSTGRGDCRSFRYGHLLSTFPARGKGNGETGQQRGGGARETLDLEPRRRQELSVGVLKGPPEPRPSLNASLSETTSSPLLALQLPS